jgi:hypothetical protein
VRTRASPVPYVCGGTFEIVSFLFGIGPAASLIRGAAPPTQNWRGFEKSELWRYDPQTTVGPRQWQQRGSTSSPPTTAQP